MMADTFAPLALATLAFIGSHILLSSMPIRVPLVARLGKWGFMGTYSVVSLATFVWMNVAYSRAPFIDYWVRADWMWWLSIAVTFAAAILLACGFLTPNPTLVASEKALEAEDSAKGIFKVARHPLMWGIILWSAVHMLVTGDAASLIYFGGLLTLALFGMLHMDARRDREGGAAWVRFAARTSIIPFAALIQGRASVTLGEIGWIRILVGVELALRFGEATCL